jgi:carbonic anhydrase
MSNKRDAPINIETSINTNPERSCISTCQYSFQYNNSSCNVYHEGEFFRIPYDAASGSYPANFKGTDYQVDSIRIYQPSLHSYDGQKADAELLAYHSSADGRNLIVCIPIVLGSGAGQSSSDIMNRILQNLPEKNSGSGKYISDVNNFNLGNLIPRQPFYFYTGKNLVPQHTGVYNYIVYHKVHAIQVMRESIRSLNDPTYNTSLTKYRGGGALTSNTYYYNKKGANNAMAKDDIYIKCQPTGEDGTVLYQQSKASLGKDGGKGDIDIDKAGFDINQLLQNEHVITIIRVVIGFGTAVILFYVSKFIFYRLGNKVNSKGEMSGGSGITPREVLRRIIGKKQN